MNPTGPEFALKHHRYSVRILVRNMDNADGDDSDDYILTDEILAISADNAAHLIGVSLNRKIVSPN